VSVCLALLALLAAFDAAVAGRGADMHDESLPLSARADERWIQDIVDDFRARLPLPQPVRATLVATNALVVSVEPLDDGGDQFLLSIEEGFLHQLSDEELKAVVAHELGHVWIYTHHPYLQTEALANQIARRLVSRDSLVSVYEKVWKTTGSKGDLARFVID
jgi:Zn-dependent protease with chaperone function